MAPFSQSLVGGTQASGTVTPTSALKASDTSQAPPIFSVSTASDSTRPARGSLISLLGSDSTSESSQSQSEASFVWLVLAFSLSLE